MAACCPSIFDDHYWSSTPPRVSFGPRAVWCVAWAFVQLAGGDAGIGSTRQPGADPRQDATDAGPRPARCALGRLEQLQLAAGDHLRRLGGVDGLLIAGENHRFVAAVVRGVI